MNLLLGGGRSSGQEELTKGGRVEGSEKLWQGEDAKMRAGTRTK